MQKIFFQSKYFFLIAGLVCLSAVPVFADRLDDSVYDEIVNKEISDNADVQDLNDAIEEKAEEVRDLAERIKTYEDAVKERQKEELTLRSQISLLEDEMNRNEAQIDQYAVEVEILETEEEALVREIESIQDQVQELQGDVSELMFDLYITGNQSPIEIVFSHTDFSSIFSDIEYTERVQSSISNSVTQLEKNQELLDEKKELTIQKKEEVDLKREDLEVAQVNLEGQETYTAQLLVDTQESEEEYQQLLEQYRQEKAALDGQISALQNDVQERVNAIKAAVEARLADEDDSNDELTQEEQLIINGGDSEFIWPLASARSISCGFHCDGYPFARYFVHSGIDVPVAQGSSVYASAGGIVTLVKHDGTPNLSYIVIDHLNGTSSVYMHLSCVKVAYDGFVSQGQDIACSGGLPNTPGAGPYSTGAHLHFEIREDGIPVDPLKYLP